MSPRRLLPVVVTAAHDETLRCYPFFYNRPRLVHNQQSTMAQKRLMSELQTLQKEKWVHIDVDDRNVLMWKIGLMVVNPDSAFNGAYLRVS